MTVARRDFAGGAAATTLAGDINATSTTINITAASGWPTGANGEFYICIARGTAAEEKALVLSRSGTALTLASSGKRGVDGTSAASHVAGVAVEHCLAAADLDEPNNFIANPGLVGSVTASAPGDTALAGAVGKWADVGHRHAREAATPAYPRGVVYRSANVGTQQAGMAINAAFVDITGLTSIAVTGDAVRRFRISGQVPQINAHTTQSIYLALREGSTTIAYVDSIYLPDATAGGLGGSFDLVPTIGAHTYKFSLIGGGTCDINSGSGLSWACAEDIGT